MQRKKQLSASTFNLIELPRCLGVVLRVLSSDRIAHSVPLPYITSNHPLVGNVLSHLPLQLRLNSQIPQLISSTPRLVFYRWCRARRGNNGLSAGKLFEGC